MEYNGELINSLDREFDSLLNDMKPYVLKLHIKSDRQKCASWIKKLCDPLSGISERKTRNSYAQLILNQVRKGYIEHPINNDPPDGLLPLLLPPSNIIPDWVNSELPNFTNSNQWLFQDFNSVGSRPDNLFTSHEYDNHKVFPKTDEYFSTRKPFTEEEYNISSDEYLKLKDNGKILETTSDIDWTKINFSYTGINSEFPNLTSLIPEVDSKVLKLAEKEISMKTKVLEAKFQEEKLKMQQRHDGNVQKILERKNIEIDEIKNHCRNKNKHQEENLAKLEKRVQSLLKEINDLKEAKEKQLIDLKRVLEESHKIKCDKLEKKIQDVITTAEKEKISTQKEHTLSIEEIISDTKTRFDKMEEKAKHQLNSSVTTTNNLEKKINDQNKEINLLKTLRTDLENENKSLLKCNEKLEKDFANLQLRFQQLQKEKDNNLEEHTKELKNLQNKYETNAEYFRQENNLNMTKASETIDDLKIKLTQCKFSLESNEQRRQNQLSEFERMEQQNRLQLENTYEEKLRNLTTDLQKSQMESRRKIDTLEKNLKEKELDLSEAKRQCDLISKRSDDALHSFKLQVEQQNLKAYDEMQRQMKKVEHDLDRSKHLREKQSKEFQRQLKEQEETFKKQLTEIQNKYENDKQCLLKESSTHQKNLEIDHENILKTKIIAHRKEIEQMEKCIDDEKRKNIQLREEMSKSKKMMKNEIVELTKLKQDEKIKTVKDYEEKLSRLQNQTEQERVKLQKDHSGEMAKILQKTDSSLRDIESEYSSRAKRDKEKIQQLQEQIDHIKNEFTIMKEQNDQQFESYRSKVDEEKKKMKHQNANNLKNIYAEIDLQKTKCRQMESMFANKEQVYEEKIFQIKLEYEERLKGMLNPSIRMDLESTIESLKSQINILHQKSTMLQDELNRTTAAHNNCGLITNLIATTS